MLGYDGVRNHDLIRCMKCAAGVDDRGLRAAPPSAAADIIPQSLIRAAGVDDD
jgi:hypothetical protein